MGIANVMWKNSSWFGLKHTYDSENLSLVICSSESGGTEGPRFADTIKPPQDKRAVYWHNINGESIPSQEQKRERIRKNNARK